jgi:hypothetical protein
MIILTCGGNVMDKKKFKRMVVTITLIGAFFMFGTGVKKAQSATNIGEAAYYALAAGFFQGAAENACGLVFAGYAYDYLYEAYAYYLNAADYAYNSALYASYSSAYYAYNAYINAYDAWLYLLDAADYQYTGWYYDYADYTGAALSSGGLAAQSLAYVLYYAAYLS